MRTPGRRRVVGPGWAKNPGKRGAADGHLRREGTLGGPPRSHSEAEPGVPTMMGCGPARLSDGRGDLMRSDAAASSGAGVAPALQVLSNPISAGCRGAARCGGQVPASGSSGFEPAYCFRSTADRCSPAQRRDRRSPFCLASLRSIGGKARAERSGLAGTHMRACRTASIAW